MWSITLSALRTASGCPVAFKRFANDKASSVRF